MQEQDKEMLIYATIIGISSALTYIALTKIKNFIEKVIT